MSVPEITDARFWGLIDDARAGSRTSADPEKLGDVLSPLANQEVSAFGHMFYEKLCDLNQWRLWAAGYIIAGDMSGDSFHYFRSWIIGKGREVFAMAMKDPNELGPCVDDGEVENELLEYIATELLNERGVEEDPRELAERTADDDPTGQPFEEDTVFGLFPKLAAQFEDKRDLLW